MDKPSYRALLKEMTEQKLGLSVDEAVAISGIGRSSLYESIRSGELLAKKAGRRTIILRPDLEAFLSKLPTLHAASRAA